MPHQVHLIDAEPIRLAVVRSRARPSELGATVQRGCGTVWNFVRAHGLKAGRNAALYLNANIDLEAGVEVAEPFEEGEGIAQSSTPAGPVASTVHIGPYQALGAAHDAIHVWCAERGHRLTGVRWEIYGHWQPEWNADPSRIRTDVFYQIAAEPQ